MFCHDFQGFSELFHEQREDSLWERLAIQTSAKLQESAHKFSSEQLWDALLTENTQQYQEDSKHVVINLSRESDHRTPISEREPLIATKHKSIQPSSYKGPFYRGTWRWAVLFAVALLCGANGMQWIAFSPIADITEEYWSVSTFAVGSLSTM